jgi:hypothetical protein
MQKRLTLEMDDQYMKKRWGDVLHNDPAYSPSLTLEFKFADLSMPFSAIQSPTLHQRWFKTTAFLEKMPEIGSLSLKRVRARLWLENSYYFC